METIIALRTLLDDEQQITLGTCVPLTAIVTVSPLSMIRITDESSQHQA